MKIIFLFLLFPIIFSYAFAQESPETISENLTPRMQVFNGVTPDNVTCKNGFELIFKYNNGNPACVKPDTAKKLLDVKWGLKHPFYDPNAEELIQFEKTKGWLYSYCDKAGGILHSSIFAEMGPSCNLPTSDKGKECTDSSQCESFCQAKEGAEIGSEGTGICYGYQWDYCQQAVRGGIVQSMECE